MADSFIWRVATGGYEFSKGLWFPWKKNVLVPRSGGTWRAYFPLEEHTGLFHTFADVEPTPEGICEFANQYGHLGLTYPGAHLEGFFNATDWSFGPKKDADLWVPYYGAEPLDEWQKQISLMRETVRFWHDYPSKVIKSNEKDRLIRVIRSELAGRTQTVIRNDQRRGGKEGLVLDVLPINLIGALWLQLAKVVTGNKETRTCSVCGRPFVVSPDDYRTNRIHCSGPCRSRAYRGRKKVAMQLAQQGQSAKQIARKLACDVESVKHWIGKP